MRTIPFAVVIGLLLAMFPGVHGQTWQQLAHVGRIDSLRASDIECLLVPTPGVYLAATDVGIYRSTDAGAHWGSPWTGDTGARPCF